MCWAWWKLKRAEVVMLCRQCQGICPGRQGHSWRLVLTGVCFVGRCLNQRKKCYQKLYEMGPAAYPIFIAFTPKFYDRFQFIFFCRAPQLPTPKRNLADDLSVSPRCCSLRPRWHRSWYLLSAFSAALSAPGISADRFGTQAARSCDRYLSATYSWFWC